MVCMEVDQLPTKPGPYYWREKDGDKWSIKEVYVNYKTKNLEAAHISSLDGRGLSMQSPEYIGGQWLPIPPAEELVELQAKAKAYDKGSEQWQIWDPCHSKLEMIGRTESEAITAFRHSIVSNNPPEPWSQYLAAGYTCHKVRVCKEVENEKGKE